MERSEQLSLLKDVSAWNQWRVEHPDIYPDLTGIDLSDTDLRGVNFHSLKLNEAIILESDLREANLIRTVFRGAKLYLTSLNDVKMAHATVAGANFEETTLKRADLRSLEMDRSEFMGADLTGANMDSVLMNDADFSHAVLRNTNLFRADLTRATFHGADLRDADLQHATLVEADFSEAKLDGCKIFGSSTWGINLQGSSQANLVLTPNNESLITVDSLAVAQFVYLILTNANIRTVIDTIGKKAVLILGRFTPQRMAVLEAIREAIRARGYVPILFSFDKPDSRDLSETVSTLAHLARFVIADLTSAKSLPQELQIIVPHLPSVPIQPLIAGSAKVYSMFEHFSRYPWVLPTYRYRNVQSLISAIDENVIIPAEAKALELIPR